LRASGVEGSVTYEGDGVDVLLCGFDNPFIGDNTVNVTLTGARAPVLSCRRPPSWDLRSVDQSKISPGSSPPPATRLRCCTPT
jgi:hypothetical protein